jgi:nucleoside phosphorylase
MSKESEEVRYDAYDINLMECYYRLIQTLEKTPYTRSGITKEEYLSRMKESLESYSKFNGIAPNFQLKFPVIVRYPVYNYHGHLGYCLMTYDLNKIHAFLDWQFEAYTSVECFPLIVEHGVYDWIKNNSPFDNETRLQKIMEWVEKNRKTHPQKQIKAKKIAEILFDIFRKSNSKVGHIIMWRNIQHSIVPQLNPKEQDLLESVLNGLITEDYIQYETDPLQCIRLTEKGFEWIYKEEEDELGHEIIIKEKELPIVVILTALQEEYLAVRAHLNGTVDATKDGTSYEKGIFEYDGKPIANVIIRECGQRNPNASQETERAIWNFTPQFMLFVGIAGSLKPNDFSIGDVIFPEHIHYYEGGKSEVDGYKARPDGQKPTYTLMELAKRERNKTDWKALIKGEWDLNVKAKLGIIACGEQVVEHRNSDIGKILGVNYNDTSAIEMEGFGFLNAAFKQGHEKTIKFIGVVRGISDIVGQSLDNSTESNVDRRPASAKQVACDTATAFAFWLIYKTYEKSN